jgi:hypothetical protein
MAKFGPMPLEKSSRLEILDAVLIGPIPRCTCHVVNWLWVIVSVLWIGCDCQECSILDDFGTCPKMMTNWAGTACHLLAKFWRVTRGGKQIPWFQLCYFQQKKITNKIFLAQTWWQAQYFGWTSHVPCISCTFITPPRDQAFVVLVLLVLSFAGSGSTGSKAYWFYLVL